jgi:serine/threonine protein kinase/tetratricopeptide (TPR) repeat protein
MDRPQSRHPSAGLVVGATLAHFRIGGWLGAGGMGEVYRAEDTRLGRQVALKILPEAWGGDSERVARFVREASILASLNHPNIATIYEIGREGHVRFLVMELVQGTTLGDLIPAGGIPVERFFQLAIPLADALASAHRQGIVHRDLKPANVMVTPEGRVKVLDFGVAKLQSRSGVQRADLLTATDLALTRGGDLLGTVPYMAPEQLLGRGADERADIFALGCIFYEMLTGARPFAAEAEGPAATLSAILRDSPRPLSDVRSDLPATLDNTVLGCLEKDPAQRPQTMTDLHGALEEIRSRLSSRPRAERDLPSVAVLPFVNMNRDPESEFFSDGLTEEIINALTHLEGLRVTSRTSVFRFKDRAADVREIGRDLQVGAVLEGSVRRSGARLRVTAQLINVADGFHLWSERYDRQLEDVFEVQDDVARAVAERLRGTLLGSEPVTVRRPTASMQAYDLYLKGRYQWERQTAEGFQAAIQYFQEARAADPRFAQPRAWLAVAYHYLMIYGHTRPSADLKAAALAEARAACELDDDLAEAHEAMGLQLQYYGWDWEGTEREYRRAMALSPGDATVVAWYAILLARFVHRHEQAVAEARRALAMDPTSFEALTLLSYTLSHARRASESVEPARLAVQLYPGTPLSYFAAAASLLNIGNDATSDSPACALSASASASRR